MNLITTISSEPKQGHQISLPDGDNFTFNLIYRQNVLGWFADIAFKEKHIKGIRLVNTSNLLNQFKNIMPFGILIYSRDKLDPIFLEDFSNKRTELYILNKNEI